MKKRLGIFVVLIAVLVFGISAQGAFASKEHYFGKTPRGQKIYYTVKSVKKHTIRKYASKPSKSDWKKYVKGVVDVSISFFDKKVGIPYSVVSAALGLKNDKVKINYGTRFFSDAQMHSIKERTFYIYEDKKHTKKRVVYKDQYGTGAIIHTLRNGVELTIIIGLKKCGIWTIKFYFKLLNKEYSNEMFKLWRRDDSWIY